MKKFLIYAHDHFDSEADMIYLCTCDDEDIAKHIKSALHYEDTLGRENVTGLYDYYIKEIIL